jgi:hypothetical protein
MSRTFLLLFAFGAALLLPSCSEKSEAEKADEERAIIREERRKKAIEVYRTLLKEHPDDPKAAEAKKKIADLEAMAPKN